MIDDDVLFPILVYILLSGLVLFMARSLYRYITDRVKQSKARREVTELERLITL